jgi:hypothetical protein
MIKRVASALVVVSTHIEGPWINYIVPLRLDMIGIPRLLCKANFVGFVFPED